MENLIFSLNATLPIFLLMVLGYIFHRMGLIEEKFAEGMNKFVFNVTLPALVFNELSHANFRETWDAKYVLFCFFASLFSILIGVFFSRWIKDASVRGEFSQAAYRSSSALLGCAFVQNIYGSAESASLMILGAVPLYNIAAVFILNFLKPIREPLDQKLIKKTIYEVVTNPIILGILVGFIWSLLHIPQPAVFEKTVSSLAALATPLGLMSLGASFDFSKAKKNMRLSLICSIFKLVIFVGIFLPIAIMLGFREQKLVSILIMLGAATTVSCFVMAKSMGHEGTLTSSTVVVTTLGSAFTLTFWLFILRSLSLI